MVLIVPHDRDEIVDGVRIRAVPKPKGRMERMTRTAWQVYKAALEEHADLYHVQNEPELLPWAQLLRLKGKRIIYDMHENSPKALPTKPWIKPLFRPLITILYQGFEKLLLRKTPVIYAEESYLKDYTWVNKSVTVLNMPLTSQLLEIDETKYLSPTIGYLGGVTPERGSLITLEALKILKEKGYLVDWECLGPASNEHKEELINTIERYELEGIRIRGYVLPFKGWRIIVRCHIGLALLKSLPNYYESYPTKLFEYMALGIPVITSSFPLYRRVVEKEQCGICVDPENPKEIAQAIQWLLDNPDKAEAMGKRGREATLKKYNWDNEAVKMLDFYEAILNQNNESRPEKII